MYVSLTGEKLLNQNATVKSTHSEIKIQFAFLGNKGSSAFTSVDMSDVKPTFISYLVLNIQKKSGKKVGKLVI